MRRKDREMGTESALRVVDACRYAILSMQGDAVFPYAVPISIIRKEERLYFHCAPQGMKTDLLRKNPHVCIVCVGDTHIPTHKFTLEYESAILFGRASEVRDDAAKTEALRLLCLRYAAGNMAAFEDAVSKSLRRTSVWEISIDSVTGKRKKYDNCGVKIKYGV